jgi:hypothetical protein
MNLEFSTRVRVFADEALIFTTHGQDAARLLRDGLVRRRCSGRRVKALDLVPCAIDCSRRKPSQGNPHKYTFVEGLGTFYECPCGGERGCTACGGSGRILQIDSHCQSLKLQVADPRNWPIYRAALVDCLPAHKQAEIRAIFKPQKQAA